MKYETLLKNAPKHDSEEFIEYLRKHNKVLHESPDWLVIKNCKYGWPTAFAKIDTPSLFPIMLWYGDCEWKVKPKKERSVKRFHIHITG